MDKSRRCRSRRLSRQIIQHQPTYVMKSNQSAPSFLQLAVIRLLPAPSAANTARNANLPARDAFQRISPGSTFFASECGLHVGIENLIVTLGDRDFYTCLAVYCDGNGTVHRMTVRRELAARPYAMTPAMVRGVATVDLAAFLPKGFNRDLAISLSLARQLLQSRASAGWVWPEGAPTPPPSGPFTGGAAARPLHATRRYRIDGDARPFNPRSPANHGSR